MFAGHGVLVYLLPMVVGVGALWLPTQGTVPNTPWYLELTVATKITIGFFLGESRTLLPRLLDFPEFFRF